MNAFGLGEFNNGLNLIGLWSGVMLALKVHVNSLSPCACFPNFAAHLDHPGELLSIPVPRLHQLNEHPIMGNKCHYFFSSCSGTVWKVWGSLHCAALWLTRGCV